MELDNVDEIITRLTVATSDVTAAQFLECIRRRVTLAAVCDQLGIEFDTDGIRTDTMRKAIVREARAKISVFAQLTYDENIALTRALINANRDYGTVLNHWDHFSRDARFRSFMASTSEAYSDAAREARELKSELLGERTGLGIRG